MKRVIIILLLLVSSGCGGPYSLFPRYFQERDFVGENTTAEQRTKDFNECMDEAKLHVHYENLWIEMRRQNEYVERCMERRGYQPKPE